MDNNQTPAPLSADGLREQIEEAAMYGFIEGAYDIHGIPIQSIDKLEALIAAALQSQRQRIADSLPEKRPGIQEYHENGETYHTCKYCGGYDECDCEGFNECLAAVKAVLIPPTGELGDSDVTTQSHPGDT